MKNKKVFWIILGSILLVLSYEVVSLCTDNETLFPSINKIFLSFLKIFSKKSAYSILFTSLLRMVLSWCIGFVVSIVLVVLTERFSFLDSLFIPMMSAIKSVPAVLFTIFLLIYFGRSISPYIIVTLVIFPIQYEGLKEGIKDIKEQYYDMIVLDDSIHSIKICKSIYIPLIFTKLKGILLQSFGLGCKAMLMAEILCQPENSIGREILFYKTNLEMDACFAWSFLIILFLIILESITKGLQKKEKIKTKF